jgi:hypothetical protein
MAETAVGNSGGAERRPTEVEAEVTHHRTAEVAEDMPQPLAVEGATAAEEEAVPTIVAVITDITKF